MAMARPRASVAAAARSEERIVEQGDIYFAYRPRVDHDEADGLADVQRFFMVLKPAAKKLVRLAVLGRKRLPDVADHERIWGFIDRIGRSGAAIGIELGEHRYATKTRGERTEPAARPAGEGVYALLQRGDALYLTYELSQPEHAGEVQEQLNIAPHGAYILSIANPERSPPAGAGLPDQEAARYPKALQAEFHGRRFAAADPGLLDFAGAEFVLIGARNDPERAYAIDLDAEPDDAATADIFRQLKMSQRDRSIERLFKGEWR